MMSLFKFFKFSFVLFMKYTHFCCNRSICDYSPDYHAIKIADMFLKLSNFTVMLTVLLYFNLTFACDSC